VFVVKTFNSSGNSCVVVEKRCRREFFVGVPPPRDNTYWNVKESEETGNVCDVRKKGRKLSASARIEEAVGAIREVVT
jgi:hypothetical protein